MNQIGDIISHKKEGKANIMDNYDPTPKDRFTQQAGNFIQELTSDTITTPRYHESFNQKEHIQFHHQNQASSLNIEAVKTKIYHIKDELDSLLRILQHKQTDVVNQSDNSSAEQVWDSEERIIEGVFNGETMIGPDGKEYAVPPNYASKSKLVEGDMMKLTITKKGTFIYKQTCPTERSRIIGELFNGTDSDEYSVLANGKNYKVLSASVTFHKGKNGDEAVVLIPKDSDSEWAAIENIINK